MRFITTFHNQHRKMEKVLAKHGNIQQEDPHPKTIIPDRPRVTYHRAPILKNSIAPSKLKSTIPISTQPCLIPLVGMYQCHKALCKTCHFVKQG